MVGLWWLEPLSRQTVEEADRAGDAGGFFAPVVLTLLGIWAAHLTLKWMGRRGWIRYHGGRASSGVGNALMDFGAFLEPQRPTVEVVQKLQDERLTDDAGEGRDYPPPPVNPVRSRDDRPRA